MSRTVSAVVCGVALGAAGLLMQALTRNPIADPGVLGVNAGASFGVVAGLAFAGAAGADGMVWFAMAGAAVASAIIVLLASSRLAAGSPVRLTLAGVALSAVLAGATQTIVVTNERVLDGFRFWRVGSVAARTLEEVVPLIPFIIVGAVVALLLVQMLNLLALSDDTARSLGVRPGWTRVAIMTSVVVLCGAATAIAGPISFIGLVVPHLLRRFVGPDHRLLMPFTMIVAPALVLVADVIGRVVAGGAEVPVGVIAAFIGGPLLVMAVLRRRSTGLS